jgi:mannose-1-phosphate guanylyltransferase / phosphomannomutase
VLESGGPLFGYVAPGYWEDVGTTAAYLKAHEDILNGAVEVDIAGFELRPGVWLGKGSSVDPTAEIVGPVYIGENCSIDADVELGSYSTIGANTRVGERAIVRHSVIGENAYLGPAVRVEGAVIGRTSDLRRGARCDPGSVVGEGCLIGAHAEIRSDVKVYPYKVVEAGAQVNASIVWESAGARALFGPEGVKGLANVDISPELAVRLAKAWASTLEKGSTITTSRDTSRAARMLKRALMVGANSVGANVVDLEVATIPVTRHHIRTRGSQAGLTVRLSPKDPESVTIRFFDQRGLDLSESEQRRIERLYHREDFRRVTAGEIGDIDFSPRAIEHYTADVVEAFHLKTTPRHQIKLVLDLSYGAGSFVMPNLLSKLAADVLSINPFAQTPGMISVDRHSSARRVADAVRGSGADLGAVIDAGAEHLTLVDGAGHVLTDDEAMMAFLDLVTAVSSDAVDHDAGGHGSGRSGPVKVALPVTASSAAFALCAARGAEVVLSSLSPSGLMEAAAGGGVNFAADQSGGFIFPAHLPSFDAAAALVQLIDLLGQAGESMAQVVERVPDIPILHSEVETPFEQKGLVMRTLMEQLSERESELTLVDGIKLATEQGWVLVVPDPEEPTTHIWAEGADLLASEALTAGFVERLRLILQG